MPDRRRHRGQHPQDSVLFREGQTSVLRDAVQDLSHLLSRGYSEKASVSLVGDRYQLRTRQRLAVQRSACSDQSLKRRIGRQIQAHACAGRRLELDGYNVLITVESAMAGGVLLEGRDGCLRDLASVHGSYRRVDETLPAILAVGRSLVDLRVDSACWYLDAPVSNSGRLRKWLLETAQEHFWDWQVELVASPDHALAGSARTVVSSDSWILDRAQSWFNLSRLVVERLPSPPLVIARLG